MSTNKNQNIDGAAEIEQVISKSEAFFEKYQKHIIYSVLAVILVACAIFLISRFYMGPRATEAQNQVVLGERYFAVDSFAIALNGNGDDFVGFAKIADEYNCTDAGNLSKAYVAICSYKLGEYEKAINYADDFDGNGDVNVSVVMYGLMGDAASQLNKVEKALSYYEKAYESENKAFAPLYLKKAAILSFQSGDKAKATELFQLIKDKYITSTEAQDIDKYLEISK